MGNQWQNFPGATGSQRRAGGVNRGKVRQGYPSRHRFNSEKLCAMQPTSGVIACMLPNAALALCQQELGLDHLLLGSELPVVLEKGNICISELVLCNKIPQISVL